MKTPDFFNDISPIVIHDPLCVLLGVAEDGMIVYTYTDVVKLTGHSCPTVAGAYLMVQKGLKALYGDGTPVRGEIKVLMNGKLGEGVVGVIANVASMITGATDTAGFHGLGGKFDRRQLLFYEIEMEGEIALERADTLQRVILTYDPSCVASDLRIKELLPLVISGCGDEKNRELFATLWQDRVKQILMNHKNNPQLVKYVLQ